jgi:hypothetical protein
MRKDTNADGNAGRGKILWLIYVSLILSGAILIADAINFSILTKLTARLGVGLVFSAIALLVGKDRPAGIIATSIIWISIVITFFN